MKKIKFTCPHCEAKLRVPTHLAGVSAPCPKCGSTITAPSDVSDSVIDTPIVRRPANPSGTLSSAAPSRPRPESSTAAVPSAPQSVMVASGGGAAVMEAPVPMLLAESSPAQPRPVRERPMTAPVMEAVPSPSIQPIAESAPASPAALELPPVPATEVSPAFFTPPPPVPPAVESEPETESEVDDRSDPPLSLQEDAQIVVEEHYFPEVAPALPAQITQPIQISTPRGDLPYTRTPYPGGESLPRLDVSLAGNDPSTASALLFGETSNTPGRTRVILPQPGSETDRHYPGDFLAPLPVSAPAVTPSLPEKERTEAESTFTDFEELAGEELPATQSRYTTIPLPQEMAPIPLDDLESSDDEIEDDFDAFSPLEDEAVWEESPPLLPELPVEEEPEWHRDEVSSEYEPTPTPPAGHPWPQTETSSVPLQSPLVAPVSRRPAPPETRHEEIPLNPLHEGSFGKLFAQQATAEGEVSAPKAIPPIPPMSQSQESRNDSDVLDELFASTEGDEGGFKGFSKTVWISSIVGVSLMAIVVVAFVIKVLGGLAPEEAYRETAGEPAVAPTAPGVRAKIPTSAATADAAPLTEPPLEDAPAIIDPAAISRESEGATPPPAPTPAGAGADAPALSYDEKVQQAVNGTRGSSIIGSPGLDLMDSPPTDFSGIKPPAPNAGTPPAPASTPPAAVEPTPLAAEAAPVGVMPLSDAAASSTTRSLPANTVKDANYNPPDSFPAPGPDDSSLGKTRDLIDAYLRAPDAATRVKYSYQGDSLRPVIEDYYKKWSYNRFERYTVQLYQVEVDTSLGGPYWVFIVSISDDDDGFPLIVRTEGGNLKVDWEIFAEFSDRQFLRFREGTLPPPATLRVIIERFSDYYGSDRDAFTDLSKYYVYQVNPPYGGELNEFSEFVFVEKDSELAKKLDGLIKMGDEPLAVILKLDQKAFPHGVKHFVISDLVTEGWFN